MMGLLSTKTEGLVASWARQAVRYRKVLCAVRVPAYRTALREGVLAGTEHEGILRGLDIDAVVDVGANRGQFSLVAKHLFSGCPIMAVEPLEGPANLYERVVGPSAVLHRCAVGRAAGELDIFETADDDSSSLLSPGPAQLRLSSGSSVVGTRRVQVRTLDTLCSDLEGSSLLLKIDVQGFELEALAGATELLRERVAHVYVEASLVELYRGQPLLNEVVSLLAGNGFGLDAMTNPTVASGRILQADFLFTRTAAMDARK